jgi:hypothetical protein
VTLHSESERPLDVLSAPPPIETPAVSTEKAFECELCRRELVRGDGYHVLEMGFNEEPLFVGVPGPFVEETETMTICTGCKPGVSERLEAVIAAFWADRAEHAPAENVGSREEPEV